jgi:hypothetical protein
LDIASKLPGFDASVGTAEHPEPKVAIDASADELLGAALETSIGDDAFAAGALLDAVELFPLLHAVIASTAATDMPKTHITFLTMTNNLQRRYPNLIR